MTINYPTETIWKEVSDAHWDIGDPILEVAYPLTLEMLRQLYLKKLTIRSVLNFWKRTHGELYDEDNLIELLQEHIASVNFWILRIKKHGLLLPEDALTIAHGNHFYVWDGNHRLVAAKILNLSEVPTKSLN